MEVLVFIFFPLALYFLLRGVTETNRKTAEPKEIAERLKEHFTKSEIKKIAEELLKEKDGR